jgi:hypothetical protein
MDTLPPPDEQGLFEAVIGFRPERWPWALPHLYALNTAGNVVETIGYWNGRFAVYDRNVLRDERQAGELAASWFEELPVRHLMEEGRTVRTRPEVEITGEWPTRWTFRTFVDVRIFASYLFEVVCVRGGTAEASRFRESLRFAYPMTELLVSYRDGLALADELFVRHLEENERKDLRRARKALEKWLRR